MSFKNLAIICAAMLVSGMYCMERVQVAYTESACVAAPENQADQFINLSGEAYQFSKYIDGSSTFQIQVRSAIDLAQDRIFLVESRKMAAAQLTEVKAVLTSDLEDIAAIKFDDPMYQHLADSTIRKITATIQRIDSTVQKIFVTPTATSTSIVQQPKCAGGRAYAYMLSTKAPIAINVSPKRPAAILVAPKSTQAVQVEQAQPTKELKQELSSLLSARPKWLKDDWGSWPFGNRPVEKAWNDAQQAKGDVLELLKNLDTNEHMLRGRRTSNAEILAQAAVAFQELVRQAHRIGDFGLDLLDASKSIDANRRDFAAFTNEIESALKITQTCFDKVQASSDSRPAARFIKTSSAPQWIAKEIWQNYVENSRAFVLDHYGRVAPVADDVHLGRLLLHVCLLEQQLPATIDVDYAHELIPVQDELKFVGGVLNQWLTDQRCSLGYPSPQISSEELSDIAHTMAMEEHDKQRAEFYKKDIPDQIVGVFVQAAKFYCSTNVQGLLNIGVGTDLKGTVYGNLGAIKGTLHSPSHDDGSAMFAEFAKTYQRCTQNKDGLEKDSPPTPAKPTVVQQDQQKQATQQSTDSNPASVRSAAKLLAYQQLHMQPKKDSVQDTQQPAVTVQTSSSTEPGIILGSPVDFGAPISDKTVTWIQTGASGAYILDAISAKQLQEQFATASAFLTDKAEKEAAAGNTTFAQELLEGAQYAAECAKTFGHCLTMQFGGNVAGLVNNGPVGRIMQDINHPNKPKTEQEMPALVEPRYKGVVQEWCAWAGCKGGDTLCNIMLALLGHKVGEISSGGLPPPSINPGGVAVQGAVADGVATGQAVKTGIVIASGHGPEQSGGSASQVVKAEEVAKHNAPFKVQVTDKVQKVQVEFLKDKIPHIFADRGRTFARYTDA